jgi:hypothetical protein
VAVDELITLCERYPLAMAIMAGQAAGRHGRVLLGGRLRRGRRAVAPDADGLSLGHGGRLEFLGELFDARAEPVAVGRALSSDPRQLGMAVAAVHDGLQHPRRSRCRTRRCRAGRRR